MAEQSAESPETGLACTGRRQIPSTGSFIILIIVLWALNLADIFQTLYLKNSELLEQEANWFINYFLQSGPRAFIGAKVLALVLITLILVRGWFDKKGLQLYGKFYEQVQVRCTLHFLLLAGVLYYTIIVIFPFVGMFLAGYFTP